MELTGLKNSFSIENGLRFFSFRHHILSFRIEMLCIVSLKITQNKALIAGLQGARLRNTDV